MVELYLTKVEAFVRKSPDCWFVAVKIGWLGWLTQDGVCHTHITTQSLVYYVLHCGANPPTQLREDGKNP